MQKSIGYDCDGNELFEYMVVRAPFYSDIDFDKETGVDPRLYCVLQGSDLNYYLISVFDWWNQQAIKREEKINGDIPVIVKDIKESENYEISCDSDGKVFYYSCSKEKIKELLEVILENKKLKEQKESGKKLIKKY